MACSPRFMRTAGARLNRGRPSDATLIDKRHLAKHTYRRRWRGSCRCSKRHDRSKSIAGPSLRRLAIRLALPRSLRLADVRCHQECRRTGLDRKHRHKRLGGDRGQRRPAAGGRAVGSRKARPTAGAGAAIPAAMDRRDRRSSGARLRLVELPAGTELLVGPQGLQQVAADG